MSDTDIITGATGFLERALRSSLDTRGFVVRSAERRQVTGNVEEVTVGDIVSDTDWTGALFNVRGVVNCAEQCPRCERKGV